MSHKNKMCLKEQSKQILAPMFSAGCGRKKHDDKVTAAAIFDARKDETGRLQGMTKQEFVSAYLRPYIYMTSTYEDYKKSLNQFFSYCEEKHGCKTIKQCREYADEWLQSRIDRKLSAWSLKKDRSALCKLYQEPAKNFIDLPTRRRENIKRSRGSAKRDYGFSEKNNKDIISFGKSTGLRRKELSELRGNQLIEKDGKYYLKDVLGKGGKKRTVPIIGDVETVIKYCTDAGNGLVWPSVPSHMDEHRYRGEYCKALYNSLARPIEALQRQEKYICRKDKGGIIYDKSAMLQTSTALGHGRINVIASNYLY